ncbi:unnamed protein product [Brachionus calyciflorus]|uniref:Phosphatidic acid phosphatase type 2/haloperoxidase domain-containing protein n=1 Tax=Brachionus calyciflorus TaxID=104777 RepID=A0A814SSC3_9BILA|nr:unnamed protein product [Brachionus calyciflorus]
MDKFQLSESDSEIKEESNNAPQLKNRLFQIFFDLFAITIIFIAFILIYTLMKPYTNYFFCNDTDIFYPYKPDTVELWVVAVYGVLGPIFFIILTELKNSKIINFNSKSRELNKNSKRIKVKTFFICLFHALSIFFLGIAISLLITEIGKRWIGRLRPYFIDVCKPDLTKLNCTINTLSGLVYNRIYTGDNFCTGDEKKIAEARLSFPSGHASFSCYTMTFLILFIEARLSLLRFRYLKSLIQLLALIAAFITCISRVSDYHHRGSDVIGGAVIGLVIGIFVNMVTGRVLWEYKIEEKKYELDNNEKA